MNFSKTKRISKILCLIAVLVLMSTLFAGCKKDPDPTGESTNSELNLNLNLGTETQPETSETQTQPTETEAVVNEKSATVLSQLSVRTTPSTEAAVVGTLHAGDKVIVERREPVVGIEWAYISSPMTGWICMDFVTMDMPDADNNNTLTPAATDPNNNGEGETGGNGSAAASTKGVVTAEGGLMIRSEASAESDVKGLYNKGDIVTILETSNGWGRTNKGWIKLQYVNTSGSTTTNTNTNNNNNTNTNNSNATGNGSTTVLLKGIVTAKELNIRSSASTSGDRLGSYTYGDRVEILEKDGNWGRTKKGWISLDYIYQDGTTGSKTATGTVTANGLFIRSGPGTAYDSVGSYGKGDSISILEQFTYNGTAWGCTKKGWVCMDYVDTGDSDDDDDDDENGMAATVITDGLRIRSGAGTDYDVVGSLDYGDRVTVLSEKEVDGTYWAKISTGWVSMDYLELD